MPSKKCKSKCNCHLFERQVCDICQGVTGREKDNPSHIHGPNIYDPNCEACYTFGMLRSNTINRHSLSEESPYYLPDEEDNPKPKYGYHTVKIKKGKLGDISKIQEELEELIDAENQGVKILAMCELSDLIGAIQAFAFKSYGLKLRDLHDMARLTRKAFKEGHRK